MKKPYKNHPNRSNSFNNLSTAYSSFAKHQALSIYLNIIVMNIPCYFNSIFYCYPPEVIFSLNVSRAKPFFVRILLISTNVHSFEHPSCPMGDFDTILCKYECISDITNPRRINQIQYTQVSHYQKRIQNPYMYVYSPTRDPLPRINVTQG